MSDIVERLKLSACGNCQTALDEIERLRAALKPFADFAPPSGISALPENMVITSGSPLARKQLTMGDCYRARDALERRKNER